MKKIALLVFFFLHGYAPIKEDISCYKPSNMALIRHILPRLAWVESSSNRFAVNKRTGAIGLFQIVTNYNGALVHYNTFSRRAHLYSKDMFIPKKAEKVAVWALMNALRAYPDDIPRAITAYNAGITRARGVIYTNYCTGILGKEYMNYYRRQHD